MSVFPELYKEYRDLKLAKENSGGDAAGERNEQCKPPAEVSAAHRLLSEEYLCHMLFN